MIYIFGDSHAEFNFRNLKHTNTNLRQYSVTMFRIGRDNHIINFDKNYNNNDNTFILCYGEVDCRCHIGKQIKINDKNENEIIKNLVDTYLLTIKNNITEYKQIILCSITPTQNQKKYENINGPITHEFPFVGTDEERIRYTEKMNLYLENKCKEYGYYFLDIYNYYSVEGFLNFSLSDRICHIKENDYILTELDKILL